MSYQPYHLLFALASGALLTFTIDQIRQRPDFTLQSTSSSSSPTHHLSIVPRFPRGSAQHYDSGHSQPPPAPGSGISHAIGSTPLVLLPSLSALTSCSIYVKLELLNPGGSPKDRVALSILDSIDPPLQPGDTLYEGTVGSTGISLALLCRSRGINVHIVMPADQAEEKTATLRMVGARVTRVPPAGIVEKGHFVRVAERMAALHSEFWERKRKAKPDGIDSTTQAFNIDFDVDGSAGSRHPLITIPVSGRAYFANQFENTANYLAHYRTTGPEIWNQMSGDIDAFVAGAGTGGTVTGVGLYLKEQKQKEKTTKPIRIILADPPGSALNNLITHNVLYTSTHSEGTRRRNQTDTSIEGIGMTRPTANFNRGFDEGVFDGCISVGEVQARNMARWLVEKEGIWAGGSSAVNCVAALQTAIDLGPGHRIVTIICDSGVRHVSKFWREVGELGGEAKVTLDDVLTGREMR